MEPGRHEISTGSTCGKVIPATEQGERSKRRTHAIAKGNKRMGRVQIYLRKKVIEAAHMHMLSYNSTEGAIRNRGTVSLVVNLNPSSADTYKTDT